MCCTMQMPGSVPDRLVSTAVSASVPPVEAPIRMICLLEQWRPGPLACRPSPAVSRLGGQRVGGVVRVDRVEAAPSLARAVVPDGLRTLAWKAALILAANAAPSAAAE